MVAPGDPALAADLARRAASVSHDGEAIYGAQMLAANDVELYFAGSQKFPRLLAEMAQARSVRG